MATKSIKKEDVEVLIKSVEKTLNYVLYAEHPSTAVGYCKSALPTLIKQLKGEFPII